ncbi:sugar-transfer associated ATP-grasp domain-containing protein [Sporosarcina highlanderae]|uniref:Sugar-transfer associated ATP-grasp domain-containing protein n=1 Tax=Sporosarcina highlanderae TaxID=3035916 RepID=A0ABT8JLK6_9BACL|nr:sugar-transfer associated ATP-grasp domain-containing protein [Sporosarcina highlanderae]MDN4605922.1 sugar-transfer associated ATP-grasp domain-containing protein [Sporosarcina highlanderae]
MKAIRNKLKEATIQGFNMVNKFRVISGNRSKIRRIQKANTGLNTPLKKDYEEKINNYWHRKNGIKIKKNWHQAYSVVNGVYDEKYIPEDIFYSLIEPKLNFMPFQEAYSDKNFYTTFFKNVKEPIIILRNINSNYYSNDFENLSFEEAECKLKNFPKKVVVKPSIDSGGGKNVQILNCHNGILYRGAEKITLMNIEREYGGSNFIIQECLEQHDSLNDIYPSSLNTIRVISLRQNNKIHLLSTVVRFGNNGGNVDNQAAGGLSCGVNEKGDFNEYAIDKFGKKYFEHPYTNFQFSKGKIHDFKSLLDVVTNLHGQLKYFNLVSWDIALGKDGSPILIELNLNNQEINFHQFNNGALFGTYTEDILKLI